ncbi:hypothetical protein J2Y74_003604 [Pseudomonas migulae]|nr:hypothetical protein [Pseudomonas migulae]
MLAIAVSQSTHVLAGRTPSPASRLLQGECANIQNWCSHHNAEVCARPKSQVGFQAASAAVAVVAPSRGRVEVLRSGQPGMDAGLAAPGHGWPMAAGPRSRTGARVWRALARHRTKGARALWLLWGFSKVTRCKSETNTSHHQKNGYSHHATPNRRQTKTPGKSRASCIDLISERGK